MKKMSCGMKHIAGGMKKPSSKAKPKTKATKRGY